MQEPSPVRPVKIFVSYAHQDEALLDELRRHLAVMERRGLIEMFHDRLLNSGENWNEQILRRLQEADLILLLLSPDFLASDFVVSVEMAKALELHRSKGLSIVPILLRPCDWTDLPLAQFQALPHDGKPITTWPNRDEAFYAVARNIRLIAESILASHARASAGSGDQMYLDGRHRGGLTSIAITTDGEFAATGSEDGTLIVWDLKTLQVVRLMEGEGVAIASVGLTPNGKLAVTLGINGTLKLWDLSSGEQRWGMIQQRAMVVVNDELAIAGYHDGTFRVVPFNEAGGSRRALFGKTSPINAIAMLPGRQRFVSGDLQGRVEVWDLEKDNIVHSFDSVGAEIKRIAITPDGRLALLACIDSVVRVMDLANGRQVAELRTAGPLFSIAVLSDGRRALTTSRSRTVIVWDIATGNEERTLELPDTDIAVFDVIPNTNRLVCGTGDGRVFVVTLDTIPARQALPAGVDRLRLAYLAVLENPELFAVLETFDETTLASIASRLSGLAGNSGQALEVLNNLHPGVAPPPLWSAWMQTVHTAKLGAARRDELA